MQQHTHFYILYIRNFQCGSAGFLRGCTMPAVAVPPVASPPWALSHHFWGGEAGSWAGALLWWETAGRSPLSVSTCLLCPWAQITVSLVSQASCESPLFLQRGGDEKTLKESHTHIFFCCCWSESRCCALEGAGMLPGAVGSCMYVGTSWRAPAARWEDLFLILFQYS